MLLGVFEQLTIHHFILKCVFHVFCLGLLAVHVRESYGVFATVQPSEANMFCGKLLRGKFSRFQEMSQIYLNIHSASNTR